MIHYTRHVVFFAAVTLSAAAQAQTALPAEAPCDADGPSQLARRPRRPRRRRLPASTAAARRDIASGGSAHRRGGSGGAHRAAQARAARGGGRQAREGGAQGRRVDDKGFALDAAGQLLRAEDARAAAGRRPLLRRQRRAAGERHVPGPPVPPVARRARCSRLVDFRLIAGVRRHRADPGRLRRRASSGLAAAARRKDEGAGWPRATAERRRPPVPRAVARSEPVQPARRRRPAVGRHRGRHRPLRGRRSSTARPTPPATTPTSTTPRTSRAGCSSTRSAPRR